MVTTLSKVAAAAGTLALFASSALAQPAAPTAEGAVAPNVPQQTGETEVVPKPLHPARSPAASRDEADEAVGFRKAAAAVSQYVRVYGILRPIVSFSSDAVESFGNPNQSAPTAAANPAVATLPGDSRLSFQVAQSRFGFWIAEREPLRGHFEFDFIDFGKSSPTVQSLLRLRIAAIEYRPSESLTLIAGQDWDLWQPLLAHGVNLVGTHFQSGNTGFMRNQLKVLYQLGDKLELAGAIGLTGPNAASKDAAQELGRMPTFALRATALLGDLGRLAVNAIATRLRIQPGPSERYTMAGAVGVFGELTPYDALQVRFEGYLGQNLNNLGALALSHATLADDVRDIGGFVSARHAFAGRHALYGSYGIASVLNQADVAVAYTYAPSSDGAAPALGSATFNAAAGPGMRWNEQARLGYDFRPLPSLAIAIEGFWFKTRHQLLAMDQGRTSPVRHAFGTEVGMIYTF